MMVGMKKWCSNRWQLIDKYFTISPDFYKAIAKERNRNHAVVSLLTDVQNLMDQMYHGGRPSQATFEHYNELLNDIKCVLDNEGEVCPDDMHSSRR